jgi:hypothetical protein
VEYNQTDSFTDLSKVWLSQRPFSQTLQSFNGLLDVFVAEFYPDLTNNVGDMGERHFTPLREDVFRCTDFH